PSISPVLDVLPPPHSIDPLLVSVTDLDIFKPQSQLIYVTLELRYRDRQLLVLVYPIVIICAFQGDITDILTIDAQTAIRTGQSCIQQLFPSKYNNVPSPNNISLSVPPVLINLVVVMFPPQVNYQ
ncbi:MAG: hypothetical protein EZS28_052853, partial [Streblomastix strix]